MSTVFTMTNNIVGDWLHFEDRQPKKRRAQVTCVDCHARKVKCDLQSRTGQGQSGCSNCVTAERSCHLRPSKRTKQSRDAVRESTQTNYSGTHGQHRILSPTSSNEVGAGNVAMEIGHVVFQNDTRPPNVPTVASPASRQPYGCATAQSNPSDVDTGFLQVYGPENQHDAEQQEAQSTARSKPSDPFDAQHPELQEIFAETYLEFCYTWCPVLDMDTLGDSVVRYPLLANALAVAASHIRPPLIPHEGPARYYKRATNIFYNDEETDGLATLQAVSLFYWWAPRPPTIARRHSSWWWTSVLIRHAQQMNFHREPGLNHPMRNSMNLSLRRRIWWTAFARERLTALCQSKPCIIDPDDCNVPEPTLADFPDDPLIQRKGQVFIYWVRLCAIMGRIAKTLARSGTPSATALPSIADLRQELVDWVRSLPPHLQLPIRTGRTKGFDRDVHQLYLPYLTTIIILHLRRSTHALPQALPPAILAASCIVRILKDILSRGDARFLMAITCWYSGTAFIALTQACHLENMAEDANEGLDVLTNAVEQLQRMWGSANVIRQGFDRLRGQLNSGNQNGLNTRMPYESTHGPPAHQNAHSGPADNYNAFDWTQLFPFVTRETSSIAAALLPSSEPGLPTRLPTPEDMMLQDSFTLDYQGLLEPFAEFSDFGFNVL